MESFERREKLALVYDNYSPRIIKMHLNKIKKEEEGGGSRGKEPVLLEKRNVLKLSNVYKLNHPCTARKHQPH